MHNKGRMVSAVLIGVTTLMSACGGGGGDGDGDHSSATRIATVEPLSEHRLLVTYDDAPGEEELDPDNYGIVDDTGDTLDVLAIAPLDADEDDSNQAIISTGPQQAGGYALIFPVMDGEPPDPEQGMEFTGSTTGESELVEVEVVDLEHLRLTFSEPMGEEAQDPAFYTIFRPDQDRTGEDETGGDSDQTPTAARVAEAPPRTASVEARVSAHRRAMQVATEPADTLEVLDAEFGDTTSVVLLTTETMGEPLDYMLIVGNILDQSGVYLDPTRNTAEFNSDVTPPRLENVEPQGDSSLVLTFSEPLGPSAENPDHYALSPETAVLDAMLVGDGSQVVLETDPLFDEEYELSASDIRDLRNGLLIDSTERILTFAGGDDIDDESPRVIAAASSDNKTVMVQFSKAMGDNATNPSAYDIVPAPTEPGADELQITAAEFMDESRRLTVALTTNTQQAIGYELTAIGVTDLGDRPLASDNPEIDPNHATFDGTAPPPSEDVTPPRLLGAETQGETGLLLTFSEGVNETAEDAGNYDISPATDVLGAQRLANNTQVLLETGPLFNEGYELTASNIEDLQGLLIDPGARTVAFAGPGDVDTERPRVVSAISADNTTVIVGFSKPMADSVEDPGSYAIVQEDVNPEVGFVAVDAAEFVDGNRMEVRLTTGSQNEVTYRVSASGVTDLGGRPLADQERGVDPTSATFAGTPPGGGEQVDSDGDGVPDNVETLGYQVTIQLATGETETRQVTGDPNSPDADGDGLDDSVEKTLVTDPRSADTDNDGLTDFQEFNETFSSPTNQDSDGDGIADGTEYNLHMTSPILVDSDGDQTPDGEEADLGGRNVRVADLPTPTLEIGEMNLMLDVRFVESNSTGTTEIDSKTATSTLTQSESQEFSNSSSETLESSLKTSASMTTSVTVEANFPKGGGVSATSSFTAGVEEANSSAYTTAWSETSRETTTEAYQESLTTEQQVTEGSSLTRQVEAAQISVAVTLKNAGDIAFTIRNLQVTALIQDPADPTSLVPVATLVPDAGLDAEFNLGTLSTEIGPLIFSNDQIFPQMVESLMANPRGLVFRFSNYDIVDEFGRNFAFTSEDITDRTAALVIDYGGTDEDGDGQGDLSETFRVATGSGRRIDTDGDGDIDSDDRRVTFDAEGQQVGITLRDGLQAAGLQEYDENVTPTDSLGPQEIENSYSIQRVGGDTRIFRIRNTAVNPDDVVPSEWFVVTSTGIDRDLTLDQVILQPGGGVLLAFVQDLDRDNLPALVEFANNCLDSTPDTDDDSLDDRYEALRGWEVTLGGRGSLGTRRSSCDSRDTDDDGLSDLEEAPGVIERDANGLIFVRAADGPLPEREPLPMPAPAACTSLPDGPDKQLCLAVEAAINDPITDPTSVDTDGDGLNDAFEVGGFTVAPRVNDCPGIFEDYDPEPGDGTDEITDLRTSPEHFDSDGDGVGDGMELTLGGNPRCADAGGGFGDTDGDGLLDIQEETPRSFRYELVSGDIPDFSTVCPVSGCEPGAMTNDSPVTSSSTNPDEDDDGLTDFEEFQLGTSPDLADSDGDGLTDFEEVNGFDTAGFGDFGILTTDPLDADTDDDQRLDGAEVGRVPDSLATTDAGRPHFVRVPGEAPIRVFTNPLVADADLDGLVDGDEVQFGGDPHNFNTDSDRLPDRQEVDRGSRLNVPDVTVTLVFTELEVQQDGDGGSSAAYGEWTIDIDVIKPNGTSAGTLDEFDTDLPACIFPPGGGDDPVNPPCDLSGSAISISDGDRIALDEEIEVGGVSTTDVLFEQFTLDGSITQSDGDVDSCLFLYPGGEDNIFKGSELQVGNTTYEDSRTQEESTADDVCEYTLRGRLEVR